MLDLLFFPRMATIAIAFCDFLMNPALLRRSCPSLAPSHDLITFDRSCLAVFPNIVDANLQGCLMRVKRLTGSGGAPRRPGPEEPWSGE